MKRIFIHHSYNLVTTLKGKMLSGLTVFWC